MRKLTPHEAQWQRTFERCYTGRASTAEAATIGYPQDDLREAWRERKRRQRWKQHAPAKVSLEEHFSSKK